MKTVGTRIRHQRKLAGISQAGLAKALGVSQASVTYWENDTNEPAGKNLLSLAEVLCVSPQWIATGRDDSQEPSNVEPAKIGRRPVPVINEVQAGNWHEIRENAQVSEYLLTDLDLSPHAFALVIKGKSMEPDFWEGDKVIIDPSVQPAPGDFVVATNGADGATFKRYRERGVLADGSVIFELVPSNQDYPVRRSDVEPIRIIGTMVEKRQYRRR